MFRDCPDRRMMWIAFALFTLTLGFGCGKEQESKAAPENSTTQPAAQPQETEPSIKRGSIEITARLAEIPGLEEYDGDFPSNDLGYDYAYIVKYVVQKVHRGELEAEEILVGQYNPLIPRDKVADEREGCEELGGTLRRFREGDVHRLSLEVPIDEYYMGPMFNKYFGKQAGDGQIYWAVWTDAVSD